MVAVSSIPGLLALPVTEWALLRVIAALAIIANGEKSIRLHKELPVRAEIDDKLCRFERDNFTIGKSDLEFQRLGGGRSITTWL